MVEDAYTMDAAGEGGWTVAGVLTDLQGALLTAQVAEAGMAGKVELEEALRDAANDAAWEGDFSL